MARKTVNVTIDAKGRDLGKVFVLRELSASAAEKWAARAFLGLAKSGIVIPEDIASSGVAGIFMIGFKALMRMDFELLEPLLDEMMTCVQIMPDPRVPQVVRALIEDDIEEVLTRIKLRKAVFGLHTGFFSIGAPLTSGQAPTSQAAE